MTWGHPAALWLLALVPLLLWARRRRPITRAAVGSLHLWVTTVPHDTVSFARRLRRHWLVIVQIALVAMLILSLAQPSRTAPASVVAIVLDTSMSMGARDGAATRLDAAKARIAELADGLPASSRVRLVAAGSTIADLGEISASAAGLTRALSRVQSSDTGGNLTAAVTYASQREPPPSIIHVVTDVERPASTPAQVQWTQVGEPVDNVAVTALGWRADPGDPTSRVVLATIRNLGTATATPTVVFLLGEEVIDRRRISLPARSTVTVTTGVLQTGIVTARLEHADALPADDVRRTFVRTGPLRVRVIGENAFLQRALAVNPDVELQPTGALGSRTMADADVLVCVACSTLPETGAGLFSVPAPSGATEALPIVTLRRDHAVVDGLSLDGTLAVHTEPTRPASRGEEVIAISGRAPIVMARERDGRRVLELLIDIDRSPLATDAAFPLLVANALEWLAAPRVQVVERTAGETRDDLHRGLLPDLRRAGIHRVTAGPVHTVLVNPETEPESDLRSGTIRSTAPPGIPAASVAATETHDLSGVLRGVALALLAIEWFWGYARRPAAASRAAVRAAIAVLVIAALAGLRVPVGEAPWSIVFVVDQSNSIAAEGATHVSRINRLGSGLHGEDRAGLVVFGADAAVERRLDRFRPAGAFTASVDRGATNIESALATAAALLPAEGARRVVLLSDGLQTHGDADRMAATLVERGIALDVAMPDDQQSPSLSVSHVQAPSVARSGDSIAVTGVVEGTAGSRVEVNLSASGAVTDTRVIVMPQGGRAPVTFLPRAEGAGLHVYEVHARAVDEDPLGLDANRRTAPAGAVVSVVEAPRVLYVGRNSTLADRLGRRGVAVLETEPSSMANSTAALRPYDGVILDDVAPDALTLAQSEALTQYVETLGGGLLTLGSTRSLEPGLYTDHPLGRILPVDLRPRAGRRTTQMALVVAFDKSGSMDDRIDGVPRIEFARQAVRRVFDTVAPGDGVGVIAFDSVPQAVLPLATDHDAGEVAKRLQAIEPSGPTAIGPALELARDWLSGTPSDARRHVLLVSDGRTSAEDMTRAQRLAAERGFELSVVALGADADRRFLAALASRTGGRAYFPDDVRQLPAMVAREAARVAGGRTVDERFIVRPTAHPMLNGLLAPWPPLSGYVVAATKAGADAVLRSHLDDPILAAGRAGLGRVAVYTADLHGEWSSALRDWSEADRFLSQTVQWMARRIRDDALYTRLDLASGAIRMTVEARRPDGDYLTDLDVRAAVQPPSGATQSLALTATAPGRYVGSLPAAQSGPYFLTVVATGPGGVDLRATRGIYGADQEREGTPDRALLQRLAEATGGEVIGPADNPLTGPRGRADVVAAPWLTVVALALFTTDLVWPAAGAALRRRRRASPSSSAREAA